MNSVRKNERNFKMKIYKKSINIINIKINNDSNTYYNSEIIFYSKNTKQNIKLEGFEISDHNSKNRKRILIYNENKEQIEKIIKDNNNNRTLQNKALEVIKNNSNKLLLINIYQSEKKTNILIFVEEEKSLILPSKSEKQFFKNFYWAIYTNKLEKKIINSLAEEYKKLIIQNKILFGQKIQNLDDDQNINIYFSFINQGINSLFDNNIISRYCQNDYYFILGYILLFVYFYKKTLFFHFVNDFFFIIDYAYKKNYSYVDLIRIGVSYAIFCTNNMDVVQITFTDELEENDPYKKGFEFFKSIISDLNEDSDLIFIYLQINSGCGLELISNEKCYKLSMIAVEDIKSHIIENIPKYFYIYSSNLDNYISTDAITQVMIFNEKKVMDTNSINKINNNIMNITIGMLHESGHLNFHMNTEVGGDRSPVNCINKRFDFTKKYHWKNPQRRESGKLIDHFLYNSSYDEISIVLISSLRSNELMNKNYFINDLDNLNNAVRNIVISNISKEGQDNNINEKTDSISNLSSKLEIKIGLDNEESNRLINIGGDVYY